MCFFCFFFHEWHGITSRGGTDFLPRKRKKHKKNSTTRGTDLLLLEARICFCKRCDHASWKGKKTPFRGGRDFLPWDALIYYSWRYGFAYVTCTFVPPVKVENVFYSYFSTIRGIDVPPWGAWRCLSKREKCALVRFCCPIFFSWKINLLKHINMGPSFEVFNKRNPTVKTFKILTHSLRNKTIE